MADIPELTAPQIKVEIQEEMTPEEIKAEMVEMAKPIVDPVPLIDRLITAMPVVELFKRQVDMFQREQNITPITSPLYMQFQIMKDYHRDLMKIQIGKLRGMATEPVNLMIEALGLVEDGDGVENGHGLDLKNLNEIKEWVVNCHKMMEWGWRRLVWLDSSSGVEHRSPSALRCATSIIDGPGYFRPPGTLIDWHYLKDSYTSMYARSLPPLPHLSTGPPTMQVLEEYRQCFLGYKMLIRGALKAILFFIGSLEED
ncbi:unnamed protein product [Caenorhabditis brenneri]